MTAADFLTWRKSRNWTQGQAGAALGISVSQIANYETGRNRGKEYNRPAPIPRAVALACAAIALGLRDYPG